MESRMEKYYNDNLQEFSRSKKNTNLYKEVYGSYSNLEYLPVSDNVSEIDAKRLEEIVASREEFKRTKSSVTTFEEPIKKYEENKIYDINELIEQARSSKPQMDNVQKEKLQSYNFLKTLESNELLKSQINEAKKIEKENSPKINSQTTSNLSLDILSDLKPVGDTVVMEAISTLDKNTLNDIPIDNGVKNDSDKTFYSGSYSFSKNDFFEDDDDFYDLKKKSSFTKAIIIVIVLSICITAIYFLINYL